MRHGRGSSRASQGREASQLGDESILLSSSSLLFWDALLLCDFFLRSCMTHRRSRITGHSGLLETDCMVVRW